MITAIINDKEANGRDGCCFITITGYWLYSRGTKVMINNDYGNNEQEHVMMSVQYHDM